MMKLVLTLLFGLFFIFLSPVLGQNKTENPLLKKAKDVLYDNPDESIEIAKNLLKSEKKADGIAALYMTISNAYLAKRETDSSLFYLMKTTNLINSDATITTKIRILNSVAVQYQQMELYSEAQETLDKVRELCLQLPLDDKDRKFNLEFVNMIRGMIYRSQSNPEMALEKFSSAVTYLKTRPKTKGNSSNISIILYNMGYCYMELKENTKAKFFFTEAIKYGRDVDAKSIEAYALKGLAESFYNDQNYVKSLELLNEASTLAKPVGDLTLSESIYKLMANNYLANNNLEQYQFYDEKVSQLKQEKETREQKSLNRYINNQTFESLNKTGASKKRFMYYQISIWGVSILLLLFLLKNILAHKKHNRIQKNNVEKLTNF